MAFFSFKYGKIDWLEQDAPLRTDFHITTSADVKEVGYPVIVKPDNGVGASNTYKLDLAYLLHGGPGPGHSGKAGPGNCKEF